MESDKRLYARQVLVKEIGAAGQAQLCAAAVALDPCADARAAAVAREYLARAGVRVHEAREGAALIAPAASSARVRTLAGADELRECAAWLAGSFAAVEAIKRCTGAGTAAELPAELVLAAEVG